MFHVVSNGITPSPYANVALYPESYPPPLPALPLAPPPPIAVVPSHAPFRAGSASANAIAVFSLPALDGGAGQSVVERARVLMPVLFAIGTFGAGMAFSTFYTARQLETPVTQALLAWVYTSFLSCTVITMIWQLALAERFRVGPGRMLRSPSGILVGIATAIAFSAVGAILLSLAIAHTGDSRASRGAGYAAIGCMAILACVALLRLYFTIKRRARGYAQYPHDVENQEAGFTEREDAELARFLRMLPLWGTHLSRLDSVSAFQRLPRQEQSDKLVSCIIAFDSNIDRLPGWISPRFPQDIRRFHTLARKWQATLDVLHAAAGGAFYRLPLREQVWRLRVLKEDSWNSREK